MTWTLESDPRPRKGFRPGRHSLELDRKLRSLCQLFKSSFNSQASVTTLLILHLRNPIAYLAVVMSAFVVIFYAAAISNGTASIDNTSASTQNATCPAFAVICLTALACAIAPLYFGYALYEERGAARELSCEDCGGGGIEYGCSERVERVRSSTPGMT